MALDGESSAGSNSTGIAVVAAVSMVAGYVLLAALWWFVFRPKARLRRERAFGRNTNHHSGLTGAKRRPHGAKRRRAGPAVPSLAWPSMERRAPARRDGGRGRSSCVEWPRSAACGWSAPAATVTVA